MASLWEDIKKTTSSLGGMAVAPAGVVWDLGSAPFDDDDDDILGNLANRGGQFIDPFVNSETLTGATVGGVMDGANWLLDNGVNRPVSTFLTNVQHAGTGDSVGERIGTLFDGDDWQRAWAISDEQNAGQALATMVHATSSNLRDYDIDPFDYKNPYDEWTHPEHGAAASTLSWGANIGGAFFLDPFAVAGKGLGLARQASMGAGGFGKLSNAQKAELGVILNDDTAKAARRVDRWMDWVAKSNSEGRALTGPEILAATPELTRWAKEPRVVASLVSEASSIADDGLRRTAVRDILSAAAGDPAALRKLEQQQGKLPAMADQLKNMLKDSTLSLEKVAANPDLAHNPLFIKHLEGQLHRLNSDKAIDKMLDQWGGRLQLMQETGGTLTHLPGLHNAAGRLGKAERALARTNDRGALRTISNKATALEDGAVAKVDEWAAKIASNSEARGLMIQKGLRSVPVLAIRTVGLAASPYTKALPAAGNALRQTHFTGVAKLDEWDGAVTQLDSMMAMAKVPLDQRMKTISAATLARGESDKQAIINQVEKMSMTSLAKHYSAKTGDDISADYIEQLMVNHAEKRGKTLAQMYGRAYAATKMDDAHEAAYVAERQAAFRGKGIQAAEDDAVLSASKFNPTGDPNAKWSLRVDQLLDDDGMPVALPFLETQLRNAVPLMDMGLAKKLVKQDTSHLSRLSRAWSREKAELDDLIGKHGRARGAAADKLAKAIEAKQASMDWLGQAGQKTLRVWKMSVLFRLGYPARVVLDDHWRIWSKIGAATFYGQNAPEAFTNFRYNQAGRYREAKALQAEARAHAASLADELKSDRVVNYAARAAEHKTTANSIRSRKGQITKLKKQLEAEGADTKAIQEKIAQQEKIISDRAAYLDYLQQQMGDVSPDDIQKELDDVLARLRGGRDEFLPEKKHIGQADVTLSGGEVIPGSMAGPSGRTYRQVSGSRDTMEYQIQGVEERTYGRADRGAHTTLTPDNGAHLGAWSDVLNNQVRNSPAAMHFVKGGTVEDFVKWVKAPEQADLRRRLPHLAHDPEDWGKRIESFVHDMVPSDEIRQQLLKGTVSRKFLDRNTVEQLRPAVHGPMGADTLGTSDRALGIGRAINNTFEWLAVQPTDRLSRHPFFNSMYRMHAEDLAETRRIAYAKEGRKFTQADLTFIERQARKMAMTDLRRTLFDMSAHSHAAHVMRFISPFFAAHQEVITRWWRIVQDNPAIVRRMQQAFDAPRHAGLVVDENGDPVEPGDAISPKHRIMVPKPFAKLMGMENFEWSINENSFNLVLQNGITNPGVGPVVQVPLEQWVRMYPEDEEVTKVARLFNPYPPDSPLSSALPATVKRLAAALDGMDGSGDSWLGGKEFNSLLTTNLNDKMVEFHLENGREPNQKEAAEMLRQAKKESVTEAWLKLLNNSASPFPARPSSRYAVVQQGWWKIDELSRSKFPNPEDWKERREWAYQQFRAKYGEAYMALTDSAATNPAGIAGSPAEVGAVKRYKTTLESVSPELTRAVIGPYVAEAEEAGATATRTTDARNWFARVTIRPGSSERYIGTKDPAAAMLEAQSRRGWRMYEEVTAALNAQAEAAGLGSYLDSPELVAVRRAAKQKIMDENYAFARDVQSFDAGKYDDLLADMQQLTESDIAKDETRTDIVTLEAYLKVREEFMGLIQRRQAAGLGGMDAQATEPIRQAFTEIVGRLVQQNTFFEANMWNGLIENDPLLIEAA